MIRLAKKGYRACEYCGCVYDPAKLRKQALHDNTKNPCPGCGMPQPTEESEDDGTETQTP